MATFDIGVFVSNPSLTVLDKCKKSDLRAIADHYEIVVSSALSKAELKAVILEGLLNRRVLSLLAPEDVSQLVVGAAASPGVSPLGAHALPAAEGHSDHPTGETTELPGFTPAVGKDGMTVRPVTLPPFVPISAESTPGSKLDARLKIRLARLHRSL
ncbi:hypothetical protein ABVT39_003556 [Epinephelus coioides]